MKMKNKITNNLGCFAASGLIFFVLICSARTQETTQVSAQAMASSTQEASSSKAQAPSAAEHAVDMTKLPTDPGATSTTSSNVETNTNGVVPTDPSTTTPSSSTENETNAPLPMDPNAGNATEVSSEEASPVNSTESIEKKKHDIKVRYNEVRTQVEKEEAVVALRQAADKATTMEGQRQTLKAYYELLFKRMKQIDASLAERCDVMQAAYLRRLEQVGIEPTIPLHMINKASSTNAPTPPPLKGKSHKKRSTSNVAQ